MEAGPGDSRDPDAIAALCKRRTFPAQACEDQILLISRTLPAADVSPDLRRVGVEFQQSIPARAPTLRIPIDPGSWERFTRVGRALSWPTDNRRLEVGVISTSGSQPVILAPATMQTFLDSRAQITFPENPDHEFAMGHYLPFPEAVLRFPRFLQSITSCFRLSKIVRRLLKD